MSERRETTVTKCPACGAVASGLPNCCPTCGHQFSIPGTALPAVREPTRQMDTLVVRRRSEKRWLPRHVTVPFLAGLLVAVVVLVLLRLAASDHKGGNGSVPATGPGSRSEHASQSTRPGAEAKRPPEGGASGAGAEGSGGPGGDGAVGGAPPAGPEFPVLPGLGPGTEEANPNEIRYFRQVSDSVQTVANESPRLDELVDGNPATCLLPGRAGLPGRIEMVFPKYRRFSHVTFTVGCVGRPDASRTARITVETEGGIHRTVLLPVVSGPVTVDLAGSWTTRVVLRLDEAALAELGLAELHFYVFREEGEAPGS